MSRNDNGKAPTINSPQELKAHFDKQNELARERARSNRLSVLSAVLGASPTTNIGLSPELVRSDFLRFLLDGPRDIDGECNYPTWLTPDHYRQMYDREGIAKRVVACEPEECWKMRPEVMEDQDPNVSTPFEEALEQLSNQFNFWSMLLRVDILSGIGQYGVLLIGIDDGKDLAEPIDGVNDDGTFDPQSQEPQDSFSPSLTGEGLRPASAAVGMLYGEGASASMQGFVPPDDENDAKPPDNGNEDEEEPFDEEAEDEQPEGGEEGAEDENTLAEGPEQRQLLQGWAPRHKVLYLRAFSEEVLWVREREVDPTNPRYGLPKAYTIQFRDYPNWGIQSGEIVSKQVHWSRIIHIADNRKMSEVYGTPRMQEVYNRLYDLRKIYASGGEGFWKGAFPGMAFEVNPDLVDQGATLDTASIRQEFEKYANGLQRFLAVQGVTTKTLPPMVVDPTGHVEAQLKAIAISKAIPYRVLFGSEMPALAGTQDMRAWNSRVGRRQTEYLTPMVIRPFIDRLIGLGVLPQPRQYHVVWPDLNQLTGMDKAQVAASQTMTLQSYVNGNVSQMVEPKSFLTEVMGFSMEKAEAILKAAAEFNAAAMEEEPQEGFDEGTPGEEEEGAPADEERDEEDDEEESPGSEPTTPEEETLTNKAPDVVVNEWSEEARKAALEDDGKG